MLEGLEISVQYYKSLSTIIDYRIEAEYFDKRFLKIDEIFERIESTTFFNVANYENGRAYNSEEFSELQLENGVKVSKIGDVTQKRINVNWVEVSELEFLRQKGNCLIDDDILMTLTGDPPDVGKVNLFKDNQIKSTWNQRVARVYLQENQSIFFSSKVFFIVLYNRFCREQLERFAKGIRQRNLGVECIEKLRLPILSITLQIKLNELITESFSLLENANSIYKSSETLLLESLDLNNFVPTAEAVNVKSFKESFLSSGRLDAEYYQKKYEEIIARVKSHKYDKLGNLVNIKKSIEPGSDAYQEEGVPFIRVSNLNKMGLSEPDIHLDGVKYKDVVRPRKDTILLSKDGTVGIAYKVSEDMNAITSGAILHLSVKTDEVLPDYLTLVLNSKVVQMQAERDAGGSILQHWKPSEIEQVEIPIIDKQIQEKIALLVSESFRLKKQSEQLLETAKRAVEIAIEESEEVAMQFIQASQAFN